MAAIETGLHLFPAHEGLTVDPKGLNQELQPV